MDKITYQQNPDNTEVVIEFIGKQQPCPICGDYGEYEGEYGPVGCNPCNSRLIPFMNSEGKRVYADWGDEITKNEDGLELIQNHFYN